MTKNTYGTGSFVLMNVGEHCPDPVEGLLTTVAWTIPPVLRWRRPVVTHYALEGSIFVTGAAVQWLRDGLGIIDEASELESLAERVRRQPTGWCSCPPSPAWAAPGGTPRRGTILGITRGTGRPHLARAVVDAMVHQTRDVVDAMVPASGPRSPSSGSTGARRPWTCCCSSRPTSSACPSPGPVNQETTALGAAYLAGLAEGVWSSLDEIESHWIARPRVEPTGDRSESMPTHRQWLRAVERSRGWDADG
jgi:glycerol kinase